MYTMVLMMAVGGSADATAFGGRNKGCGGGAMPVSACYGSGYGACYGGSYLPAYTGCSGYSSGCGGYVASSGCHGSSKGGFLGGLFHRNKGGCHGTTMSSGCHGYVAPTTCCAPVAPVCCPAPMPISGCCGSMAASPIIMGGPVMAAPAMPVKPEAMPMGEGGKPATPPVTDPKAKI